MSRLILNAQATAPATPATNKLAVFAEQTSNLLKTVGPTGDASWYNDMKRFYNSSIAQATGFAADTYLAGSSIRLPVAGAWKSGTIYRCRFDMAKTAAGIAAFTVDVRLGTLGAVGDASRLSLNFAVGTAAADLGIFELLVNFRSVGGGTAAVIQGLIRCDHHLAATGLITTGAAGTGIVVATGAGFDSTTPDYIGISVNGGASFAGTNTIVQAELANI